MLNSPTHDKLATLRLHEMAHAWQEQQRRADHDALTFDERFGLLVDAQWLARENRPNGPDTVPRPGVTSSVMTRLFSQR